MTVLAILLVLAAATTISAPSPVEKSKNKDVSTDGYEYYYNYDYEDNPTQHSVEDDYDLEELVKAWREYIRERATPPSSKKKGSGGRKRGRRPKPTSPPLYYEDYEEYDCEPRQDSYRIHDPLQCDKFSECNIKGELEEMLCPDGLVFDIKSERCDYPSKVNCSGRPELQLAQVSTNCSRANGFFPFPATESCQKFFDCRGGTAYLQTCPEGVIFDSKIDACITPDQSSRAECSARKVLGFECPTYTPDEVLRFGNHDRLPHPDVCVKFFSCLRDGRPRLGACPRKTVFNPKTGHCGEPANVPGCEEYWSSKEEEEYDAGYYYD